MDVNLRCLGITKTGDIRSLINQNNALPYEERDAKLSVLYDTIVAYNMSCKCEGKRISQSKDMYEAFYPYMSHLETEEFHVLYMNKANVVLKHKRLSIGGISGTTADIRLIAKEAILCNAVSVAISHNHPSGVVNPSVVDKRLTEQIRKGLDLLDIRLLDHLIIAGGSYYSFSDEGEL